MASDTRPEPDGSTSLVVGAPAPAPLALRAEADIIGSWQGDEPVVSILCSTYEHADFIEDALRGFLGQETTFPFEAIVRDDASTDGTAEIVADFAERYPGIIRAHLQPTNHWRSTDRERLWTFARGRYLARCEGDDYWIDARKLQTQVETLERNPDAVLSHHQAIVIEDGMISQVARLRQDHCRDYTAAELMRGPLAITATMMTRNVPLDEHVKRSEIVNRDMLLIAQLGEHGGAKWEPDVRPVVHRHHPGGVWSAREPVQRGIDSARSYFWIGQYFTDRDPDVATQFFARGLAWYVRGAKDAGADPVELVASNDPLLHRLIERPIDQQPPTLRGLAEERAVAMRRLAAVTDAHERLKQRRAVRLALHAARIARPFLTIVRRLTGRDRG